MSLILDALRKMELERKAKRQNSHEIRTDVLNYRGTAPASDKSRIAWIALLVVIASAAVSGIYFFTRPDTRSRESVKSAEPLQQEPPTAIAQQPFQLTPAQPLQKNPLPEGKSLKGSQGPAGKSLKPVQKSGDEGIAVSGIAWQDERHLRRAVINGALVGEGAEIQGAKVVEIRENLVRFSRGGELFEVIYSSGR